MFELRDYQEDIALKGVEMMNTHGFVYLSMEVRCGKTLTALSICDRIPDVHRVLFLTKKKAISSITDDSDKLCPHYELWVQNYESLHKLPPLKWDVVILDEAHGMGAFPKPSKRAKDVRHLIAVNRPKVILLSGTPTPESYSQMYHQVYGIPNNPFSRYKDFYRFADEHVNKKQRKINGLMINDYSDGEVDNTQPHEALHHLIHAEASWVRVRDNREGSEGSYGRQYVSPRQQAEERP
jgi:hypothetical protein